MPKRSLYGYIDELNIPIYNIGSFIRVGSKSEQIPPNTVVITHELQPYHKNGSRLDRGNITRGIACFKDNKSPEFAGSLKRIRKWSEEKEPNGYYRSADYVDVTDCMDEFAEYCALVVPNVKDIVRTKIDVGYGRERIVVPIYESGKHRTTYTNIYYKPNVMCIRSIYKITLVITKTFTSSIPDKKTEIIIHDMTGQPIGYDMLVDPSTL